MPKFRIGLREADVRSAIEARGHFIDADVRLEVCNSSGYRIERVAAIDDNQVQVERLGNILGHFKFRPLKCSRWQFSAKTRYIKIAEGDAQAARSNDFLQITWGTIALRFFSARRRRIRSIQCQRHDKNRNTTDNPRYHHTDRFWVAFCPHNVSSRDQFRICEADNRYSGNFDHGRNGNGLSSARSSQSGNLTV